MNRAMYKELQLQGRDFVEKNNTPQKVAEKIMNSLSIKTTEYQPSFFIDKFLLNTEQKLSKEILRLNKEVIRKYSPLYTNSPSLIQRNLI
ncbi:MAG: hypothetical protein IPH34_09130 [Chitinophagaceae bacterium]|nr:hypothetical protein [Chitinophagaceae bacterium]